MSLAPATGWRLQRFACFGTRRGTKKPQLMKLVAVRRINKLWERTEKEDPPEPPSFLLSRGAEGPRARSMPTAPLIQCPTDHWRAEHERRRQSRAAAETNKKWQGVKLEYPEGESLALSVESRGGFRFHLVLSIRRGACPRASGPRRTAIAPDVVNGLGFVLRRG